MKTKKKTKTTIAPGIYCDGYAYEVRVGRHVKPGYFPLDTPVRTMQSWQEKERTKARTPALETPATSNTSAVIFEDTLPRYLATIAGEPEFKQRRSHARAWLPALGADGIALGKKIPETITAEDLTVILQQWKKEPTRNAVRRVTVQGYTRERNGRTVELATHERLSPITGGTAVAPRTVRHRLRILRPWLRLILGRAPAAAIFAEIDAPEIPDSDPTPVPIETILAVAENLRTAGDPQTYARFLVLNTTAQRPCQVMWAEPEDLRLTVNPPRWTVRKAKHTAAFPLKLNADMLHAWAVFTEANAWGDFDTSDYGKKVHAAGWPAEITPYHARHSVVTDALENEDTDVSLEDVQKGITGHKRITTTDRHYARFKLSKYTKASDALDGRFAAHFQLRKAK